MNMFSNNGKIPKSALILSNNTYQSDLLKFYRQCLTANANESLYAKLTKPHWNFTNKNFMLRWNELEHSAFQELIKHLCSEILIVPFDRAFPTRLYVDSNYAGMQATVVQD